MSSDSDRSKPEFGTFRVPRSVYYGVLQPEPADTPPGLLLAFHGYGQSANSFIKPLMPFRESGWLVVAPQAPNMFYWQQGDGAAVGFTWMTRYQRENSLHDNRVYLTALFEQLRERYTFDEDRVFALGFSQGCAMSFRFAASDVVRVRGLVACAGDLPADVEELLPSLDPFPVRIVHGREDSSVRFDKAQHAETALKGVGYPVDLDYFDGDHVLPEAQIVGAREWIDGLEAE